MTRRNITIVVSCESEDLEATLHAATQAVLAEWEEGTYGPFPSEYTIAYWPEHAEMCLACGGSAYTIES